MVCRRLRVCLVCCVVVLDCGVNWNVLCVLCSVFGVLFYSVVNCL